MIIFLLILKFWNIVIKIKFYLENNFILICLTPVYNILKDASSSLGFKHFKEIKKKISKFYKVNTLNNIFLKKEEET